MKRFTKKRVLILLGIVLAGGVAGLIVSMVLNKPQTLQGYETPGGLVYDCSRPIAVEDRGDKTVFGNPSPQPIHQADADKYCHYAGIE